MDISFSSKSNIVINEDSATITTKKNTIATILSSSSSANAITSTPVFADEFKNKNKNSVAFNFTSPPPICNFTSPPPMSNSTIEPNESTEYHDLYLRHRNKRITLNDHKHLEAELKIKESYLKQLKSIDVAKYSFPNE